MRVPFFPLCTRIIGAKLSKFYEEIREMIVDWGLLSKKYLTFYQPANDYIGAYLEYLHEMQTCCSVGGNYNQSSLMWAWPKLAPGGEGRVSVYTVMLIDLAFPLFKQVGKTWN